MMAVLSPMSVALLAAIPKVPFNPRPVDWVIFVFLVGVIIVIYVVRYLASNRKTHEYIHHTVPHHGDDAPNDSSAG